MALRLFVISLTIVVLLACASNVRGQEKLYIAFEVSNIHTIDLTTATYSADIALKARFENGSAYYGDLRVSNRGGGPTWTAMVAGIRSKRFYGALIFIPNLSKFPFDSQLLEFSITHPTLNASRLELKQLRNESYVSNFLRLSGWRYSNSSISIDQRLEQYAPGRAAYSQLKLSVYVQRTVQGGIQILLSPSFALIMVFVSFWLPIKEGITRIGMATSALVSEVFIHVQLRNSSLVNLNSLVVMDWFMIICYLLILLAILTNVTITVLLRGDKDEKRFAKTLGSRVRYVVWFFGPGLFTFLFFSNKYLWVPFLCIILPTVVSLAIRQLVIRIKFETVKRNFRPPPPTISDSDSDSDFDEEAIPPKMDPKDSYELDARAAALRVQLGLAKSNHARRTSLDSLSSS